MVKKELHLAIEGLSQIAQKAKKGNESKKKKKTEEEISTELYQPK